jgi:hypothetical protein
VDSSEEHQDDLHDAQVDELDRLLAIDDIEALQGATKYMH